MASKRAVRRRSCEKKKPFYTLEHAMSVKAFQENQEGRSVVIYQCPFGSHFHIGHTDKYNEVPGGTKHARTSYRPVGQTVRVD